MAGVTSPIVNGTSRSRRAQGARGRELPAELRRPFRILAFDWDGTAVMSRQDDASQVRSRVIRLLELGAYVVVITGTSFRNVDRQLSAAILGDFKQRLFVCTNRGSEVFGFDPDSRPVLIWKRTATADENRQLTEIAETVQHAVEERTGLPVRVIYNRLNRRKIDLIPVPEWSDPPKSAMGKLLAAVQRRLTGAGLSGGIRDVIALAERVAREKGLPEARITSDVKHVEVGLTDKGDSIDWVIRTIARDHQIPDHDILIAGDEFGPIAGFEGSDARMMVPSARGAVFVSVGPEPNGVPAGVIHLGGGPDCFRSLLDEQIEAWEGEAWVLVDEGSVSAREREIESLFTVSNGYVGTRGSIDQPSLLSEPATFVAGVFTNGPNPVPELMIAPDWARFHVEVEGRGTESELDSLAERRRCLNLRRAYFERAWHAVDGVGRVTRMRVIRFVSLAERHLLVETLFLTPENYSGRVAIESVVDGRATNAPVVDVASNTAPSEAIKGSRAEAKTVASSAPRFVRQTAVDGAVDTVLGITTVFRGLGASSAVPTSLTGERWIADRWEWDARIGSTYRVEKFVSIYTSRDGPDPRRQAARQLARTVGRGADPALADHEAAWEQRWTVADVQIHDDDSAQRALRFAAYHLISAANPHDECVSIGARALTGASYKGHVFWDTEIYMLPFFVFADPPAARSLLMYRFHGLPAARAKARTFGYQGALYPWESTDSGEEASPRFAIMPDGEVIRILTGDQEHHISADVAYAVWQYWQATGDDGFFLEAGAEMILETARFWASRSHLGDDGCYHINQIIGPDEYHESVDDDAYTNGMARWNLERGAETMAILRDRWPTRGQELTASLAISASEPDSWLEIARRLHTGFDAETGLFEQFRGYFEREYVDLSTFEPRTAPIDVILGRERVMGSQIIKQPDVVMLIALLWEQFPAAVREANFRYYEPRCAHGSSLSPSIHALVAARLGDSSLTARFFRQAAEIDLANNMGNAAGGVHVGAQGGLWQATLFGIAGMRLGPDGLVFDPRVPSHWRSLTFSVQWRGRLLRVVVSGEPRSIEVQLERGQPMTVRLGDGASQPVLIERQWRYRAEAPDNRWGPWQVIDR